MSWRIPTSSIEKGMGDLLGIRCPPSAVPKPAEDRRRPHFGRWSDPKAVRAQPSDLRRHPVVQLTREILKAASAYFARELDPRHPR